MLTSLLWGAGFLLAVAGIVFVMFFTTKRSVELEHAALHAIAPTPIAELQEGRRVRVIGTAVATGETTKAPYTGKTCIAFTAHTYLPGVNDSSLDHRSKQLLPFCVRDATGTVEISLTHVELKLDGQLLELDQPGYRAFGADILKRETAWLTPANSVGFSERIEHYEHILEPDDSVAVIGLVTRDRYGKLRLAGTTQQPLVISNKAAALQR